MPSTAARNFDFPQEQPIHRKPPTSESSPPIQHYANTVTHAEQSSYPMHGTSTPYRTPLDFPPPKQDQERLLNAREVAARLGVSERWVRDHTTRRSPKLRGVKLGTLMRYRRADVEEFMERLTTSRSSLQPRFGG
jgi:excisionase family DNA binding protein